MSHEVDQVHTKPASAIRLASLGFIDELSSGELLTGTPIILEVDTTDLDLSSKAVNITTVTIDDVSHVAGQALQCLVTGGTAGTTYEITWQCGTDASPAQTMFGKTTLIIDAD